MPLVDFCRRYFLIRTADMLANAECANIIQVIGAGSGRTFDLSQARYEAPLPAT